MSENTTFFFAETSDQDIGEVILSSVEVGGSSIKIARPANPEALLDLQSVQAAFSRDEYMPYWASLWPISQFLSSEILARVWRPGTCALEVGCGLGLAGIAALLRGMDVVFTDYDANALKFARKNCALNGFSQPKTALLDWRQPPGETYDVIIGSDLLYERRNVEPLINLLHLTLKENGVGLIADPNRPYTENFLSGLKVAGFSWTTKNLRFKGPDDQYIDGTVYTILRQHLKP